MPSPKLNFVKTKKVASNSTSLTKGYHGGNLVALCLLAYTCYFFENAIYCKFKVLYYFFHLQRQFFPSFFPFLFIFSTPH